MVGGVAPGPAPAALPTSPQLGSPSFLDRRELGVVSPEGSNDRTIHKYVHAGGAAGRDLAAAASATSAAAPVQLQ